MGRWFLKYSFDRPILFSGYKLTNSDDSNLGNGVDLADWKVFYRKLSNKKDKYKKIHKINGDDGEEFRLNGERSDVSTYTFAKKREVWTDTIVLEVFGNRAEDGGFCALNEFQILSDNECLTSMERRKGKVVLGSTGNFYELD
jgi:hypothetical protein